MIVYNVFSKDDGAFLSESLKKPIRNSVHIVMNDHCSYELCRLIKEYSQDERLHALRVTLGNYFAGHSK